MTETTEAVANFSKKGERGLMNNIGHKGGGFASSIQQR